MRVPLIVGNWKMHTTIGEARQLVNEMRLGLDKIEGVEKVVCPPFVSLAVVKELIKGSSIKLGAQNLYFAEKGAYTGEVSPLMLADLCEFVIIGHSERRQYFGETDRIVNNKLRAALKVGLKTILCVGERLEENEAGKTKEAVTGQLKSSLAGLDYPQDLVLAYEPIWAIGTGRAATGSKANETVSLIRQQFAESYGKENARKVRILYGGSVTTDNIVEFVEQSEIDGALVGGASLRTDQFVGIVKQTSEIK
ncbi:MAG: triose-phosphate isomerase [Dehalococcoidales bacterium]|jgi:triosephosphate isomerase|nr:triose-phosphate isomerase [Dehalococcoidales bacterium]MDP6738320.1 triose-phosphate isomerase [Dehalococcoidales bacterium]|tara:strand:+ start:2484 stop:3239 length:756 start_codon:yes stop_codon:yes gene_type:complete